jgi:hypothetical protein
MNISISLRFDILSMRNITIIVDGTIEVETIIHRVVIHRDNLKQFSVYCNLIARTTHVSQDRMIAGITDRWNRGWLQASFGMVHDLLIQRMIAKITHVC